MTGFDVLEQRGLMSIASAPSFAIPVPPALDVPTSGRPSVTAVSGPVAESYPGGLVTTFRTASVPSDPLISGEPLASISPGFGEASGAPVLRGSEMAMFSTLAQNGPTASVRPETSAFQPPPATYQAATPASAKVAMAVTIVPQDGVDVHGFAFANQLVDQISVRNGTQAPQVVGTHDDGVRAPTDIKLEDLDGDSIKDLVVANSGANNVLIYPGLPGGKYAPEANGGLGIVVGASPAGITIGDIDGDGFPDMVVANRDSNDLSLLMGRGRLADWSFNDGGRLRAGLEPVACLLADVDRDGFIDILVCNYGSNTVSVIRGLGGGRFDDERTKTLAVGDGPVQLFLGKFGFRTDEGLLTVNSRSNDLTLISDFLSDNPTTQRIDSGGKTPTSAFASDFDSDGLTDLIVANTGDGKLALFQGIDSGLTLTSVVSSPAIPNPTAVLVGEPSPDGFDVYAVSAGQDAASILHFDMGLDEGDGSYAPSLPVSTKGNDTDDDELSAQLISHGDSAFNLVGVLGIGPSHGETGRDRDEPGQGETSGRINRSRAGAQSLDDDEDSLDAKPEPDLVPESPGLWDEDDPSAWAWFVLGLDEALGEAREFAGRAIGSQTFFEGESAPEQALDELALLGPASSRSPDRDGTDLGSAVDEAVRAFWPGGTAEPGDPEFPGIDASDEGTGRVDSIPTVSLGLIFAHQLLIRVAPPRRPRVRRSPAGRPRPRACSWEV